MVVSPPVVVVIADISDIFCVNVSLLLTVVVVVSLVVVEGAAEDVGTVVVVDTSVVVSVETSVFETMTINSFTKIQMLLVKKQLSH